MKTKLIYDHNMYQNWLFSSGGIDVISFIDIATGAYSIQNFMKADNEFIREVDQWIKEYLKT